MPVNSHVGAGSCEVRLARYEMEMTSSTFPNRVTDMLGVEYPIVQAPMGWIARSQLASAVSNAGGMGIIETSSGELDAVRAEIAKMADLTDKPFGVNIAQAFVRDPDIVQFVIDQGGRRVRDGLQRLNSRLGNRLVRRGSNDKI